MNNFRIQMNFLRKMVGIFKDNNKQILIFTKKNKKYNKLIYFDPEQLELTFQVNRKANYFNKIRKFFYNHMYKMI